MKLTTHLHLVLRSRIVELYLHSPYVFMEQCFTLPLPLTKTAVRLRVAYKEKSVDLLSDCQILAPRSTQYDTLVHELGRSGFVHNVYSRAVHT
jgi:hypothetical protein